jgi:hypothetical protein
MGVYDIGFIVFCAIMFCLICISVSKNILTKYGIGLLIAVLVFGIIGYNIWAIFQVNEVLDTIELAPSEAEKVILRQELIQKIGTCP